MFLRGRRLRKCKEQRIGSEPTTLGILFTSLTPFCSTVRRMNHFFISCNFSFDRKDHVFLTLIAIPFAVLPEVICSCCSSTELQAPQLWSSCSYLFVILFFLATFVCAIKAGCVLTMSQREGVRMVRRTPFPFLGKQLTLFAQWD